MAKDNGHFEIIFYILAAVVGLAVNAYRNYTKRKQSQMQPGKREANFPETLFGEEPIPDEETEVLFEEAERMPEPEPVTIPKEETVELEMNPDLPAGTAVFEHTAENLISDDIDPLSSFEETDYISATEQSVFLQEGEDESYFDLDFDLERAVIFSELLKTKYFDNGY